MILSLITEGAMAAGAVGQLIPGRPIGEGADRFLDTECAGGSRFFLPSRDRSAARVAFIPCGHPRTLCDVPRQSCQCNQRGTHGAVAFFFSIAAHQPASYPRRDVSNRLPSHANQHGGVDVQAVGKSRQQNGDASDRRE